MTRRLLALLAALLAAGGLTACGEANDADDELRAALRRTENLSYRYVYTEEALDRELVVRGLVEDDFRYKAQLAMGGNPALEEVVSDDAVAVRFLDPDAVSILLDPAGKSPDEDTFQALEVLKTQRWVVDPAGAPSLLPSSEEEQPVGTDPIIDSLTVLSYIDQAMRQAAEVVRFNPESIDYRPNEDPFPHPKDGILRYDLIRRSLPGRGQVQGAGQEAVLGAGHFRKLSVYVEDGVVREVREVMDIASLIDDIEDTFDVSFEGQSEQRAVQEIVKAVNTIRRGQGLDPFRARSMRIQFAGFDEDISVDLPTLEVVEAKLNVLVNRGREVPGEDQQPAA